MTDVEPTATGPRRGPLLAILAVGVLAMVAVVVFAVARNDSSGTAGSMSDRAARVMPFDLGRTSHTFTKTDTGGIETVVADDPADSRNVELVRSHLQYEARQFRKGDFSDPAKIHGMDMPGLAKLQAGAGRVDVRYRDVAGGGEITYDSSEPDLVDALHAWFDRQTSDHAMPGMGG